MFICLRKDQTGRKSDWSGLSVLERTRQVLEVAGHVRLSWKESDRSQIESDRIG